MTEDNNKKQLSPGSIDKFFAVQEKELRIRERELELTEQSIANSREYSLKH
ncbi:MAG: hypothetical protein QM652_08195 [Legionella sp.]|uniref:hypothetical protein n=1 Tax=Legionella sp. TaxID=459 RepID=UPI0039E25D41